MNDELHDIADPTPYLPGVHVPLYAWILLAVVGLGLLTGLAFYLRHRRNTRTKPLSIESCYEESRKKLIALSDLTEIHPLSRIATEASFAVRYYLAACLSEPALFETHEEFLLRDDALQRLPIGSRERLTPLLEHLAALKYSPSRSNPDAARTILDDALHVLQAIESTRLPPPLKT